MKKVWLALTILSAGAAAFHATRQATNWLQQEAATLSQSFIVETQQMVTAQTTQADLTARARESKHSLARSRPVAEDVLWTELQTNRADRLSPALLERLRDELGFSWGTSKDYILVSKKTFRDLKIPVLQPDGKFNEAAVVTLAITPEERGQLEAAMEKVKTDFKNWVLANVKREEPADDVLARYDIPADSTNSGNIRTNFFAAIAEAVGNERKELIHETAVMWLDEIGLVGRSTKLTIKRQMVGDEARLIAETRERGADRTYYFPANNDEPGKPLPKRSAGKSSGFYFPVRERDFPKTLRLIFPNGWADVAERESFELPPPPKK